jgi:PAS domain S-box-containing protein
MYELEEVSGHGRAKAAKPLEQRNDYWATIVEGVPAVVCRIAPDGSVRSINVAGEKITGYRREELVGENWWQVFYPGDEYRQVEQLFRDLEEAGDVRHYEMDLTRKNGTKRTISWTSINQFDETGALNEIVGFGVDVTDQRCAERLMRIQRDLGIALSAETNLTRALEVCLDAALKASQMDCGGIYLVNEKGGAELAVHAGLPTEFVESQAHLDDDELRRQLIHEGDPIYLTSHEVAESVRDFIASADFQVVAILPVRHDGRTVACLNTASLQCDTISTAARDALEGIAAQIGTAIERIGAVEKLREEQRFLKQVLDLQERERRLVAYEIHDGLAQQLTGGIMQLQALRLLQDRHCEQAEDDFDTLEQLLSDGLAEARSLIAGLRPMILDELGVVAAIDHLIHEMVRREALEIDFVYEEDIDRLVPPLETAVYRVVQEALNNARRHSESESILVELTVRGNRVRVAVEDWGVGFEPKEVQEMRFGLRGIKERARLLGGRAHVDSAPGLGTCISVDLPLIAEGADD